MDSRKIATHRICSERGMCHQVCVLETIPEFLPKVYYRSKCGDKATCSGAQQIHNKTNPELDPAGLIVGRRNTDDGDCPACCNTNFCNDICTKNNSVAIHGTQAPITTHLVTQIYLEHTSAHFPETTHAQTSAKPPATTKHSVLTKASPVITHLHLELNSTHKPSITHVVQDCSTKGYGYVRTGHLCIKFHFDIVNFSHAAIACAREGAMLVTIDTKEKMSEIWAELNKTSGYLPDLWIGGSDINHNDTFYWQTGSEVYTYTNWGKILQQPNDPHYHDQDCIILHRSDNYTWYDEPCYRDYGFICEHPLQAIPTSTPHSPPCESHPGYQLLEHNLGCVEYVRVPTDKITAHNYCIMFGSHLVDIGSEDKQHAIFKFMQAHNESASSWIGLVSIITGTHNKQDWRWEAGFPYSYKNWEHGYPNTDGDCAIIFKNGRWRDAACNEHYSFLCEKNHS
ncbi:hypothetical protein CHS0354_029487 [Potamilus streckersoni]|uniref:C-type lectin domain-containing protein n=1 Tax=Potamilus streckersoni TaxID=2493646 RepID=A0AAE0VRM6_9BIVA|nr:hypothetical protein CHS0354_029487 [Potamilus streckersoni]